VRVPEGKTLRLGDVDPRIVILRERLEIPAGDDPELFDKPVADGVKTFQRQNGIRATGILNPVTLAALNGEPIHKSAAAGPASEADLIANMERWRWLPDDLGYNHIFVNIPEFRLTIIEDGRQTHETRVVVGKPETPTPVFSDEVEFLVVNPTWTVPPSIALKEYLPRLRDNPYALQGRGFEILRNGKPVDPGSIDWSDGVPANVAIRQAPGERNALGAIKFMFPNNHAVYLHDTPKKELFGEAMRAASAGCVRVQDPFALAEMVLGGETGGWPEERVKRLIGGQRERTIKLERYMPVHLAYFTTVIDSGGTPRRIADVYGHDRKVKAELGL
jgi:L,D-transpeptidase YcbB